MKILWTNSSFNCTNKIKFIALILSLVTIGSVNICFTQGLHIQQGTNNSSYADMNDNYILEGGYVWIGFENSHHMSIDNYSLQGRIGPYPAALKINPLGGQIHMLSNSLLANNRVGIGTNAPKSTLDVAGTATVGNNGEGSNLLVLNSERPWVFQQYGIGANTALKLTASDLLNNNKNFIIDTDGFVGIKDNVPTHMLSLGKKLARTKLALYESEDNTSNYGMGVTTGQFNFNIGNPNASYMFYDQPGPSANLIFRIKGNGELYAPNLDFIGDLVDLQYNTTTGEIGYDNSSRRYKTNITTLKDDWKKILMINPVKYTRPASPDRWEYGYIAEEIAEIGLTNLVGFDLEGIPNDVKYDRMVLYLNEIIKELHADVQELKKQAINNADQNR